MAGRELTRRVAVLETATDHALKRWVRIIQHLGQTQEEAVAMYESEHGSVEGSNLILRVLV